jgi:hypothetical protein
LEGATVLLLGAFAVGAAVGALLCYWAITAIVLADTLHG